MSLAQEKKSRYCRLSFGLIDSLLELEHRFLGFRQSISFHHQDSNLRAAYIHLITDALTSILAIIALFAAKYLGWIWLDAVMGLVDAGVISK